MKLTHCKLLRKQQLKLLEYFVLEVTARSAAVNKALATLPTIAQETRNLTGRAKRTSRKRAAV